MSRTRHYRKKRVRHYVCAEKNGGTKWHRVAFRAYISYLYIIAYTHNGFFDFAVRKAELPFPRGISLWWVFREIQFVYTYNTYNVHIYIYCIRFIFVAEKIGHKKMPSPRGTYIFTKSAVDNNNAFFDKARKFCLETIASVQSIWAGRPSGGSYAYNNMRLHTRSMFDVRANNLSRRRNTLALKYSVTIISTRFVHRNYRANYMPSRTSHYAFVKL